MHQREASSRNHAALRSLAWLICLSMLLSRLLLWAAFRNVLLTLLQDLHGNLGLLLLLVSQVKSSCPCICWVTMQQEPILALRSISIAFCWPRRAVHCRG